MTLITNNGNFDNESFEVRSGNYVLSATITEDGKELTDTVSFNVKALSFNGEANIDYYISEGNTVADFELSLLNTVRLGSQTLKLTKDGADYYTSSSSMNKKGLA